MATLQQEYLKFYINGEWVDPVKPATIDVINPATEEAFTRYPPVPPRVDKAVALRHLLLRLADHQGGARGAAEEGRPPTRRSSSTSPRPCRPRWAPRSTSRTAQAGSGKGHLDGTLQALQDAPEFEEQRGVIVREPWRRRPHHALELAAQPDHGQGGARYLAAGCCMVLKPSEVAAVTGLLFAEVMHEAGVPHVFSLVNGDQADGRPGHVVAPGHRHGVLLSSTRAGILVAKAAADTVKRVSQKSAA